MSTATKTTAAPRGVVAPKAATPEDITFWENAALAALGGVSGEVRLTADEVVRKAVNCADRMFKARATKQADFAPIVVTLNPVSDSLAAGAETSNFQVAVTGTGVWTAVADVAATWLTVVSPTEQQSESGTVTFAVAANTGAERTANIAVNDQVFAVTQAAGAVTRR
jgi:hypothetical protein